MLKSLRTFHQDLVERPHLELVLLISALFYLLRAVGDVALLQIAISVISLALVLSPTLRERGWPWFAMFLCALAMVFLDRSEADNHRFLMSYWLLAISLSVGFARSQEILAFNGRLLVGLVFLFAVIWKILPGEFLDGSFFHLTFLSESRFWTFVIFFTGVGPDELRFNQQLFSIFDAVPDAQNALILKSSSGLQQLALCASYWTILIETAIAGTFILFWVRSLDGIRDLTLLAFLFTTYLLAPVISFGMLLTIMGLAQLDPSRKRLKIAYVYALLLLQGAHFIPEVNEFIVDVLV